MKPVLSILRKILTCFELYDIFNFDFDLFTCLRIPAIMSFPVGRLWCRPINLKVYPHSGQSEDSLTIEKIDIGIRHSIASYKVGKQWFHPE